MKPLIILMLAVQVALVLVTAWTVLFARASRGRPRPVWSSLAISLIMVAGVSWQIADKHEGGAGADLIRYFSPLLLGMGIMACLLLIRQRRGLDAVPCDPLSPS
jgi:hypothetical protein